MVPQGERSDFEPTRWTMVMSARGASTPASFEALSQLCQAYWYPLYAYVRRRGYAAADAEDLTQGFFARLLEKQKLDRVSREGGKFRSFLLASLNHYMADEWRSAGAQKRGARQIQSLDVASGETRFGIEPVDQRTPEDAYDRSWARALLERVYKGLHEEFKQDGKGALFSDLAFALSGERSATSYAELAARHDMSEGALKVAVHRIRKRYRERLRAEVAHTVHDPADVESELQDLMRALSS